MIKPLCVTLCDMVTETHGTQEERQRLFSQAGDIAIREAKIALLPLTYAEGEQIIKEWPDGRKEVIGTCPADVRVTQRTIKLQ